MKKSTVPEEQHILSRDSRIKNSLSHSVFLGKTFLEVTEPEVICYCIHNLLMLTDSKHELFCWDIGGRNKQTGNSYMSCCWTLIHQTQT